MVTGHSHCRAVAVDVARVPAGTTDRSPAFPRRGRLTPRILGFVFVVGVPPGTTEVSVSSASPSCTGQGNARYGLVRRKRLNNMVLRAETVSRSRLPQTAAASLAKPSRLAYNIYLEPKAAGRAVTVWRARFKAVYMPRPIAAAARVQIGPDRRSVRIPGGRYPAKVHEDVDQGSRAVFAPTGPPGECIDTGCDRRSTRPPKKPQETQ